MSARPRAAAGPPRSPAEWRSAARSWSAARSRRRIPLSAPREAPSVLQQVGVVDAGRAPRPEDRHDDGEADHDLGRGDDHDEERHDLAVQRAVDPAEGDQCQVRGVEHQLDAHEQHDRVAPDQHPDGADGEQDRRQHQVVVGARTSPSLGRSWVRPRRRSARASGRIGGTLRSDRQPSGSRAGVGHRVDVA